MFQKNGLHQPGIEPNSNLCLLMWQGTEKGLNKTNICLSSELNKEMYGACSRAFNAQMLSESQSMSKVNLVCCCSSNNPIPDSPDKAQGVAQGYS